MGPDYESRLRLRRVGGVAGPAVLLPLAVWFYAAAPGATPVADPGPPAPAPAASAAAGPTQDGDVPGVVLRASVLADGVVEVVETVRADGAVSSLDLVPGDPARGGPTFTAAEITYVDVEVQARGQDPVAVPDVAATVSVALDAPATVVEVRYRVQGAAVRTVPSPDGRALGVIAPLTALAGAPVAFEVSGAPVRTVTCPLLPADRLVCGVAEDGGFRTEPQAAAAALVVAQLDLDR